VGWLANHVREKKHGSITYYNVNRHINRRIFAWRTANCARLAAILMLPRLQFCIG